MPFVPVPGVVQVEMVHRLHGEICENVYNVLMPGVIDATAMADLLDEFKGWFSTTQTTRVCPDVVLINTIATDLTTQTGPRVEDATGLPIVGARVGSSMPGNVTVAVKWTTAFRGRSYRGRTFHIGVAEDDAGGNSITSTYQTSLINGYANLLSGIALWGGSLMVVSRWSNGAQRAVGVATPIVGISVDPNIDSQRRRLADRGS